MKKIFKYFCVLCAVGALFTANLFSQTVVRRVSDDKLDFKLLREAQNAYENADFGLAISYAEEAKTSRIAECEYKIYILENLQKLSYVRRKGDIISDILPVLKEHDQSEALNLLNTEIAKYSLEYFNNSYSYLLQNLRDRMFYPEANYLIGKVYRLEGETALASQFLLDAYTHRNLLNVSDEQYDILYELADLSKDLNDWENYEKYLLLVLKDSRFYTDTMYMNALSRIIAADTEDSVEKFFMLYRSSDYFCIKAFNDLSSYYNRIGESEKSLRCAALGSVTVLTRIQEILKKRKSHYEYTTFDNLLVNSADYEDIVDWGNKYGCWELFNSFAEIASKNGYLVFARKMFITLSENSPDVYWQQKAKNFLIL